MAGSLSYIVILLYKNRINCVYSEYDCKLIKYFLIKTYESNLRSLVNKYITSLISDFQVNQFKITSHDDMTSFCSYHTNICITLILLHEEAR